MDEDILIESKYDSLSQEELKLMAEETAKNLKSYTVDDYISVDSKVIDTAYKIVLNEKTPASLRTLLIDLLTMIAQLRDNAFELYNYQTKGIISSVSSVSGNDYAAGTRMEKIAKVQEKLSTKYREIITSKTANESSVKQAIREVVKEDKIILTPGESTEDTVNTLYQELRGFSVLEKFMIQPDDIPFEEFIEEIRIDDFNDIRIVRNGIEEKTDVSFDSPEHAMMFATTLINSSGEKQAFTRTAPAIKFRVGDRTRATLMRDPVAIRDPRVSSSPNVLHAVIRKQRPNPFTIDKLIELKSVDEYTAFLLQTLLGARIPMVFIGGTGTGKTSQMNAFFTSLRGRIISMAEVDEMRIRNIDYNMYIKDEKGRTIKNPNYLKAVNSAIMWEAADPETVITGGKKWFEGMSNAALTMTPDIIVMQEIKGSEASDLVEMAMSDHQTLASVHAAGPSLYIIRVMKMLQKRDSTSSEDILMQEIVNAFPIVTTCTRLPDGSRKISEVTEMIAYIPQTKEVKMHTLVRYEVKENKRINGRLTTIGEHKAYRYPSDKLISHMLRKGLLSSDLTKLETMYNEHKVDIPKDLDLTIYEGRVA